MTRVDLGSGGPKYLYLLLHQVQGVWGTASPLLIESFITSLCIFIYCSQKVFWTWKFMFIIKIRKIRKAGRCVYSLTTNPWASFEGSRYSPITIKISLILTEQIIESSCLLSQRPRPFLRQSNCNYLYLFFSRDILISYHLYRSRYYTSQQWYEQTEGEDMPKYVIIMWREVRRTFWLPQGVVPTRGKTKNDTRRSRFCDTKK